MSHQGSPFTAYHGSTFQMIIKYTLKVWQTISTGAILKTLREKGVILRQWIRPGIFEVWTLED